ncbi:hypothetical protein GCM10009839_00620 [Catenulispora yoronensis]|uniref:Histidine kinase/HSP90-like ATPase domain-containing protein n=1 Tax=Catenulispora yoronensis TaxID=450799 RepID=A0ABN2TIE2_9ACTN
MTSDAEVYQSDRTAMPAAGLGEQSRLHVTSDQSDLAEARRITAEHLRHRCEWADSGAVQLVVSELLSNAVIHGGGWWSLVVSASSRQLVIEVEDRETVTPSIRMANSDGTAGGMGMHIVSKLVTRFEAVVHPSGTGKTVRALWNRPGLSGSRRTM